MGGAGVGRGHVDDPDGVGGVEEVRADLADVKHATLRRAWQERGGAEEADVAPLFDAVDEHLLRPCGVGEGVGGGRR